MHGHALAERPGGLPIAQASGLDRLRQTISWAL